MTASLRSPTVRSLMVSRLHGLSAACPFRRDASPPGATPGRRSRRIYWPVLALLADSLALFAYSRLMSQLSNAFAYNPSVTSPSFATSRLISQFLARDKLNKNESLISRLN